MTTPRIAPAQQLRDDDAEKIDQLSQFAGYRPNALATMAHRPGLPSAICTLVDCALKQTGHLPDTLRYLLVCEAARQGGSPYTTTHLAHAAHRAGVTWEQIIALPERTHSAVFTPQEQALLALATSFQNDDEKNAAWSNAKAYWPDVALAEAVGAIAAIAFFTRWNTLMETVLEAEPVSTLAHVPWLNAMVAQTTQ